jgi:hypothetical protein
MPWDSKKLTRHGNPLWKDQLLYTKMQVSEDRDGSGDRDGNCNSRGNVSSIRSSTMSLTTLILCQIVLKCMIMGLSVCFLP